MIKRKSKLMLAAGTFACVLGCHTTVSHAPPPPTQPAPAAVMLSDRSVPKPTWAESIQFPVLGEPSSFLRLSAEECRRAARDNAGAANLLADLANKPSPREAKLLKDDSAACVIDTLRLRVASDISEDLRSRSAAGALELYYRLQEAELLKDILTASLVQVNGLISDAEVAVKAGAREPAGLAVAFAKKTELQVKLSEANAGIARLSAELKGLIGLDAVPGRIMPGDAVIVTPEFLDANAVAEAALAHRADLRAARTLAAGLNDDTAPTVQASLTAVAPLAGAALPALPKLSALALLCVTPDTSALRSAVQSFVQDKEREVRREATTALEELLARQEALKVTRDAVTVTTKRVNDTEIKLKNGVGSDADVRQAKLDQLQSEADEIRAIYAWKLAEIKLRRALGML